MDLKLYVIDGHSVDIVPSSREREWMDQTDRRYAYRCLPLDIANAHGWEIRCNHGFVAEWNGGTAITDLVVAMPAGVSPMVSSHFGEGVLTFAIPCLFRTDPGIDLMITGPINAPKDGIYALTGVVETDWSPYTFTMNWKFTRPGRIEFSKGEPFCQLFPIQRDLLETVEPRKLELSDNPELELEHRKWTQERSAFLHDLIEPSSEAAKSGWQRSYFRGPLLTEERPMAHSHRVKVRLKPF